MQEPQITELILVHDGALSDSGGERFLKSLPASINVHDGEHDAIGTGVAIIAFDSVSARAVCSSPEVNSFSALILVECTPPIDLPSPQCPVLLVCGRQSSHIHHEQQVEAFERLDRGRIVELESCGSDPIAEQPEQLAETVRWFFSTL